jgi:hypothetical protein
MGYAFFANIVRGVPRAFRATSNVLTLDRLSLPEKNVYAHQLAVAERNKFDDDASMAIKGYRTAMAAVIISIAARLDSRRVGESFILFYDPESGSTGQ